MIRDLINFSATLFNQELKILRSEFPKRLVYSTQTETVYHDVLSWALHDYFLSTLSTTKLQVKSMERQKYARLGYVWDGPQKPLNISFILDS